MSGIEVAIVFYCFIVAVVSVSVGTVCVFVVVSAVVPISL